MGKPTNNQKRDDLRTQILQAKYKRVNDEIKVVLDREGVAFQGYLEYMDGGIFPMFRLVERKAKDGDGKPEAKS